MFPFRFSVVDDDASEVLAMMKDVDALGVMDEEEMEEVGESVEGGIEEELEECRIVRCFGGSFESSFRSDFRIDFRSGFRSGDRNGRNGKEGRKRFKDGGEREGKKTGIGDLGIGRTLRQFKQ